MLYVKTFKERNEDAKNIRNVFARARKAALLSAALVWVDDARPGAMDEISARVVKGLKKEMESAHVVLGPDAGAARQIGFSDRA